jgi:hypothetical protein
MTMSTIEIAASDVRPNLATADNCPMTDAELDAVNGGRDRIVIPTNPDELYCQISDRCK